LYADNLPEHNIGENQVLHPGSRMLFRYWESLRAERPCPPRKAFNLKPVVSIVPQLFVLDFDARRNMYRYRLAGTGLTAFFGSDQTGRDMLAGWDSFEQQMQRRVLKSAQARLQPALIRMRFASETGEATGAELIALPFSTGRLGFNQLIGGLFPFSKPLDGAITLRELTTVRSIWTEHQPGDCGLRPGATALRVITGGKA
jgi:hypothetical protein